MSFLVTVLLLLFCQLILGFSIPRDTEHDDPSQSPNPTVAAGHATFVGNSNPYSGVESFLGIPYAKPPLGSLRLQPPEDVDTGGTVNAQSFGAECFQLPSPANANISEDCLTLNIYKPSQQCLQRHHSNGNDLPVMFWIHGGGFNDGSGLIYNATSLVNRSSELNSPVIVVTINYRLSFFGFSAGTLAIANNALNLGLLDQRQALQWVHDNIDAFGGDPRKVTIFGQSAGATSVGLQMMAYDGQHQDLFRAAILESGSPADTIPTPPPTWPAYQTAWDAVVAGVGCNTSANVFKCVQNAPEALLFSTVTDVGITHAPLPQSTFPWQPVVDGVFVADFPTKLTAAGKYTKVPMIMGFTTDEVTYVIPTTLNISSDTTLIGLTEFVLPFVPLSTIEEMLALDPLSLYPDVDDDVGGSEWRRATEIASDLFERCPGRAWIRNVTEHASTWKYRWNAVLPAQLAATPWEGVVHASDIPYVWGPSITQYINAPADIALSQIVQQAWISFASHLNPNTLGKLSPGVHWPGYHHNTEQVLVFQLSDGSEGPVGQGLHTEKDPDDRPMCAFVISEDAQFIH